MKTINVTFEDEEFEQLNDAKGDDNWRDFILVLVKPKKSR
jgi:predicted CopG family antitoxin